MERGIQTLRYASSSLYLDINWGSLGAWWVSLLPAKFTCFPLFQLPRTPRLLGVWNGKHPVKCVTVIAADYLRLFVLRWGIKQQNLRTEQFSQTLCFGRQWCVHAAPMWADNDDNHYMVTAEDGCSHALLHLPSITQPHSTSPHYITCHHSICWYLCLPHYNRRYGIFQC